MFLLPPCLIKLRVWFFFNWFHSVDLTGWSSPKTDCKNRWFILVIYQEFFFFSTNIFPHRLLKRLSAANRLTRWLGKKRKFTDWSFPSLLFPGWSQWGGAAVLSGWLSLEGAFVCSRERARRRNSHQVCPLLGPERPVACPVCPCRA